MNTTDSDKTNVIIKGTMIRGTVTFANSFVFSGNLEGSLIGKAGSRVTITKDASVRGKIEADEVRSEGTVNANVRAKILSLASTTQINGDVIFDRIEIEPGGQLNGHVVTTPATAKEAAKAPSSKTAAATNVAPLSGVLQKA